MKVWRVFLHFPSESLDEKIAVILDFHLRGKVGVGGRKYFQLSLEKSLSPPEHRAQYIKVVRQFHHVNNDISFPHLSALLLKFSFVITALQKFHFMHSLNRNQYY